MEKKQKKEIIPVIPYRKFDFEESTYQRDNEKWNATTLLEHCKKEKYPTFDTPLAAILLSDLPFDLSNIDLFVWQMKRVNDTDLKYPIIIDDLGYVCNGWHRICKALLLGHKTIKTIRIIEMPKVDEIIKE